MPLPCDEIVNNIRILRQIKIELEETRKINAERINDMYRELKEYNELKKANEVIKTPDELETEKSERIKNKTSEEGKRYRIKYYDRLHKKIECECGGSYKIPSKARHMRTNKHLSFTNQ